MLSDDVFTQLARLRASGIPFCLATVVRAEAPTSGKPGDKAIITGDGKIVGWIGGSCSEPSIRHQALLALADGQPRLVRIAPGEETAAHTRSGEVVLSTSCPSGGTIEIFLEPQLARPQLVVIGRSPVARTLLRMAALVGFRGCAVHPGASAEDFPEADVVLADLDLAAAGIGADSRIVVATMGHYDEDALEAVLGVVPAGPLPYVGLIASRRRRDALLQALRRRGWPDDALACIVNPAGRMLGDTQEEIALSVLAEIVARRNRREGEHRTIESALSTPQGEDVRTEPIFATDPICGMAVEIATARYRIGEVYLCGPGCLEAYKKSRSLSLTS